ncbi:MAG TPA: hypothetical protein VM029_15250 [Opitutaceae bacterium]|nr:hypothetical protein [Opitutaceae bacterium]
MKVAVIFLPKNGEITLSVIATGKSPRYFLLGRRKQLALLALLLTGVLSFWAVSEFTDMVENASAEPTALSRSPAPTAALSLDRPADLEVFLGDKNNAVPLATSAEVLPKNPARWRVLPFDSSRPLKRGDVVVVRAAGRSEVVEVAAVPNESVLLRRGLRLHRLYHVGEGSYVVMARDQSRIVQTGDIYATVIPALELARN